jgi:acetyl/propionyl-CoA carboxylase alpha subunit
MVERLLVANRGEIAARVMRAARELGIATVAIYARGDEGSLHLRMADRAVRLDNPDPRGAYLDIGAVLAAAREARADAVHPGYGFLAERPDFARAVEAAGLAFVGPSPATMEAFGVKTKARALMAEAGVPTVPGLAEATPSAEAAATEADRIGYPVALKASHGGGGRGIRVVQSADQLAQAFETASREAAAAFGNGELYLEKYLLEPRHIEVQIFGDGAGGAVHLFERDCSMQRRNQKLIEESPAINLEDDLRARLHADAVRAAKAGRYRSAGTVEFLVAGGRHFFLEVNARLQVEHPVTEMLTGIDLVKAQLRLAGGEGGAPAQDEIRADGHAIECRINAEDARQNFLPTPGRIGRFQPPSGPGVRVDAGVEAGGAVSPHYDSLMAKVIVHASDRAAAIARMDAALSHFVVTGVATTVPFHRFALASAPFRGGAYTTATVGALGAVPPPPAADAEALAIGAVAAHLIRPASAGPRARSRARQAVPLRREFGTAPGGWFHEL